MNEMSSAELRESGDYTNVFRTANQWVTVL